jgi:hypothetical protein
MSKFPIAYFGNIWYIYVLDNHDIEYIGYKDNTNKETKVINPDYDFFSGIVDITDLRQIFSCLVSRVPWDYDFFKKERAKFNLLKPNDRGRSLNSLFSKYRLQCTDMKKDLYEKINDIAECLPDDYFI